MSYKQISIEQWIEKSKFSLNSLNKDAKVFKITAFILLLISILFAFIFKQYYFAAIFPLLISVYFFYKSRKKSLVYLMHFRVKEKNIYEYANDLAGQQRTHNEYFYQYVISTIDRKLIAISLDGFENDFTTEFEHVIVPKETFVQLEIGDEMDVLIGSDNQLYAYNISGSIQDIIHYIVMQGRPLPVRASIDQQITSFGKKIR